MANKNNSGPSRRFLVTVFVISMLAVLIGACAYYRSETARIEQEKYDEIASIAKLKSDQIVQWRRERINEARWSATRPVFVKNLVALIKNPNNTELQRIQLNVIVQEQETQGYAEILILDTNSRIALSSRPDPSPLTLVENQTVAEVLATGLVKMSALYLNSKGEVQFDVIAPVLDQGQIIALIVRRDYSDRQLFPLVNSWPTPSQTSETHLVCKDGDDVLFLNDLRDKPRTALLLRQPLSRTDLTASQAVLGKAGMFHGKDYRGVEVLADLRPISDSPWFMVTKVDTSEIMAEARYRGAVTALFSIILVLLAGSVIAYAYRHREASIYRDLYQLEKQRHQAQEEFRTTLYSIGDAVITTDREGLVKYMNPVAEQLTGWLETEARGKYLDKVFHIVSEESREAIGNPVQQVLQNGKVAKLASHTMLISQDDSERPVAHTGSPILDEEGSVIGVVLVLRDLTEERAVQKALQESQQRYKAIFDNAGIGIHLLDHKGKIVQVNEALMEMLGYTEEELLQLTFADITHPDDTELSSRNLQALLSGVTHSYSLETRYVRKDGDTVWGYLSTTAVRDAAGKHVSVVGVIADITGLKRGEESLRNNEMMLRSILSTSPVGIATAQGRVIQWVNQAWMKIFGFEHEQDCIGQSVRLLYPSQEEYELAGRELYSGLELGKVMETDTKYCRKDGSLFDANIRIQLVDASGPEEVVIAAVTDISDRKRAEVALAKNERFLSNVFTSIPDGMSVLDRDMNILMVNQKMEHWYAHAMPFIGKKCFEVYHGANEPCDICPSIQALKSSHPAVEIVPMTGPGEKQIGWNELFAFPLTDSATDEVTGVIEFVRDITDRKSAQDALAESEDRYRKLVELSPDGICVAVKGCYVFANDAMAKNLGFTSVNDVIGRSALDFVHPEHRDVVRDRIRRGLEESRANPLMEEKYICADGSTAYMEVAASPIVYQGENANLVIIRNISDRKKSEWILQERTEALEMANKELEHFAYIASHDLREPLRKISSFAELLAARYKGQLDDKADQYIWFMVDGVHRMNSLIEDLLKYSRVGKGDLAVEPTAAEHLVKQATDDLDTLIKDNHAEIVYDELPIIQVNPIQFGQLIQNLIQNAVKFRSDLPPHIHINARKEDNYWVFSVMDNGIGIQPEHFERVFGIFQRLHSRAEYSGSGIGLAIAKKIVQRHGGQIWIESEPGKGSTFYFTVPVIPG